MIQWLRTAVCQHLSFISAIRCRLKEIDKEDVNVTTLSEALWLRETYFGK